MVMTQEAKARLANAVCIIATVFIWGLFVTPILVTIFAFLNYFFPSYDISVSNVFC